MNPQRIHPYDSQQDVHRITLYSTVARGHQHRSLRKRLYLHLDMNCFYAQVEQRAWNLYGLPLAMGGWRKPDGTPRGIVATASYEARRLGIKTAMSAFEAHRICPYIVFMQIDYDKYTGISNRLREIMEDFSPSVEKYSMDEYFMDISFLMRHSRTGIADFVDRIKGTVYRELGLVSSVGVATSKTYAKLASSLRKPDGMMVILNPDDAAQYLFGLKLDKIWGIGQRRYLKLQRQGLCTIADAYKHGPAPFRKLFGDMQGQLFYEIVTGRDKAKVLDNDGHIPDEVSYTHTFSDWSVDVDQIRNEVIKGIRKVCYRLRGYNRKARRWACHIRYQDVKWDGVTFAFITPGYTNLDEYVIDACLPEALRIVGQALRSGHKIRGTGLYTIEMARTDQMELFFQENERMQKLYMATDCLNNFYGADTVMQAAIKNGVPGKTHFVNRS